MHVLPRLSCLRKLELATFSKPAIRLRESCSAVRRYASSSTNVSKPRQPAQRSMRIAMQESLRAQGLPSDIGLLEDTFIMPTGTRKPSFMHMPKERLKLEWHRMRTRFLNFMSVVVYKFSFKPRPAIGLLDIPSVARALHTQMYTAFAEGDKATLERICAAGLRDTFQRRIEQRPPREILRWTLHKYKPWTRVVSHKAAAVPNLENAGFRQAVVRIKSRQSLDKFNEQGEMISGSGKAQDKVEYLVLQRKFWDSKEEQWMIWGTIEESYWKATIVEP